MKSKNITHRLNHQRCRLLRNLDIAMGVSIVLLLAGCGNGSDPTKPGSPYQGVWKLDYDVLRDECGLVEKGQNAFSDIQTVNQTDSQLVLTSQNLSKNEYTGEVRGDGSLEVSTSQKGNLFNDGVNCQLEEALAYNNHFENEVSSLYDLRLKCDDGFYCVTALRGTGVAMVK
jgi:hypothetical protein